MGTVDQDEIFNLSYWRVTQNVVNGVGFVDAFMEALIGASSEIELKFTAAGRTRMSRALLLSIVHLSSFSQNNEPSSILRDIAYRQNRHGRDVAPHLYDVFLECLIEIVKEYDPEYTAEVGEAWTCVLAPGLEYMKSMYGS